jgi:hypothetical protein
MALAGSTGLINTTARGQSTGGIAFSEPDEEGTGALRFNPQ